MSEKEVSEDVINDKLNEVMEYVDEKIDEDLPRIIRLMAKVLFNCRFDINELKLELLKVFKPEGEDKKLEDVNGHFYS